MTENMETFTVHLRVLDEFLKTKFSHFNIENVSKFSLPEEMKSYFVKTHPEVIRPALNTNFKMGYIVEGRGNRKFDIFDESTLKQAYESSSNGRLCLWVDPHVPQQLAKRKGKKKKKKEVDKSLKSEKRDLSTSSDSEDNSGSSSKRTRTEKQADKHYHNLKEKFDGKWEDHQLRSWATMVALGNHRSLEQPPTLTYFNNQTNKKLSQQDRLAETIAASIGACIATMRNDSSNNDDKRGKLLEQLKELKNLFDSDVLSRREYEDQKSIILQNLKDL